MKLTEINARQGRLYLVLLVGLGAVLRVVAIGRDSLWFDEAVSYLAATLPVERILDNTVQSSHPPLYYLLLHYWMARLPDGDAQLRLLGALFSVVLIPATYILTIQLFNRRKLALVSALIVAISPFQVLFSHELRMYTLLMLMVTVGVFAYLKAVQSRRWYWWLLYVVLFAAATYTHLFAWLVLAAIGLYTLIVYRLSRITWLVIISGFLLAVLFTPWLLQMFGEAQKELGSLRPLAQQSSLNPLKPLTSLTFLVFGMATQRLFVGLTLFLTLSIGVVFILELRKGSGHESHDALLLPMLILACVIAIPVLVYLIRPYFLPERTLAAASPFLAIIMAWGLTRVGSPMPYLIVGAIGVMLVGTILYLIGDPIKPPYRAAMELVVEERDAGDVVLHTSDGSYLPALRYANLPDHGLLDGDPDPRKARSVYGSLGGSIWTPERVAKAGERLWLIVALEHSLEWQRDQVNQFAERYPLLATYEVGGIEVRLHDLNGTDGFNR